jgi:hypothetical protein
VSVDLLADSFHGNFFKISVSENILEQRLDIVIGWTFFCVLALI